MELPIKGKISPSNGVRMGSGRQALGLDLVIAEASSDRSISAKWSKGVRHFWTCLTTAQQSAGEPDRFPL